MAVRTTVVGSYPKPPDEGGTFHLRKTLHARERKEATDAEVKAAQDALVSEVIAEQEGAGVDILTDGHARWDDILTPFARHMSGVEIGGLLRWFDNNVYYRRPVVTGPIEWRGPSSVEAYTYAQSVASNPVKAVIPGAVTFARLSVDEHYGDHAKLVAAAAAVLAQEAFELKAAGAEIIQIDEPALLDAPEDLPLAREALDKITAELESVTTIVATYFSDAKRLGTEFFDLPVGGFALDFVSGPENFELVKSLPEGKYLQAGIVDARNTKLETIEELTPTIDRLLQVTDPDLLAITPSAGLEFLPREKARAKIERLAEAARKVSDR